MGRHLQPCQPCSFTEDSIVSAIIAPFTAPSCNFRRLISASPHGVVSLLHHPVKLVLLLSIFGWGNCI
jgi:hypothetical protein